MGYPNVVGGVSRKVCSGIYIHSCRFLRAGYFEIGGRMAVISSPQSFIVWSAIPYDKKTIDSLDRTMVEGGDLKAGESFIQKVSHLIIPDGEHTMAVQSWKAKFPNIRIVGFEGLKPEIAKVADIVIPESAAWKILSTNDLSSFGFDETKDVALADARLQFMFWPKVANKELLVFSEPHKAVFAADVIFNLQHNNRRIPESDLYNEQFEGKEPFHLIQRLFFKNAFSFGTGFNKFLVKRMVADPVSFSPAFKELLARWDPAKIILCHGDVIERDGSAVFKKTFGHIVRD
ncbi:uncharacterized protein OGAPODRAFT_93606 [Ogataea polymorpha]|uniref:uncharacterized protein n=1 Tax=Ogataea polymorpha TaxID=460523 RepID=UPI0007F4B54A|nr:uncharacterized protein OGAPODRAFT_93606 [Ogataea polymorpha]KAG7936941.1 hypothetical protein KL934_001144 [Ogataea polymorpha]OBA16633.1 hypothetical protein OGAPODRAFT_93606 [Ogataea polymorpha]